jgi:hypothetical protein
MVQYILSSESRRKTRGRGTSNKGQHGRRRRWDEKHLGSRLVAKGEH